MLRYSPRIIIGSSNRDSLQSWIILESFKSYDCPGGSNLTVLGLLPTSDFLFIIIYLFFTDFPFMCSNIPTEPYHGLYNSDKMRCSRACGSYQDFFDRSAVNKVDSESRVHSS
jgi:hypothetical protein